MASVKPPRRFDLKQAHGTWEVVRHKAGRTGFGKPDGTGPPLGVKAGISGDRIEFRYRSNDSKEKRTVYLIRRIDSTKSPKQIDVAFRQDGKTLVRKGIYTLEKDVIKCEFAKPGDPRPKRFEAKPDSPTNLLILQRARQN